MNKEAYRVLMHKAVDILTAETKEKRRRLEKVGWRKRELPSVERLALVLADWISRSI